ncbi:DUF4892 domain-containing protein [Pontibacterium granulatum]|uniref:DUF4892 domain-containing protein n=1 Tax=Pontibacterium granulatum TaxID=2036029 RepID=UPI00249B4B77|nr:DUF4892 domain-containing protein [Pontibacterium granulatum]MDI3324984.1 DUF4892 domain-containing protein [Pontibacterium granulatum]
MLRWLPAIFVLVAITAQAQSDRRGSADHPAVERFPLSYIVDYRQREVPEYRLILGGLEKVDGVIRPESEQRLKGDMTRITYRMPAGHSSTEPFHYMRDQLLKKGAQVMFECQGRDCGSSNYWANSIFHISRLYGVDQTQHYLAAQLGQDYFVLYTVIRGNKRVYAHLEVLSSENGGLSHALETQGYARLETGGELPATLFEYLEANPEVTIWVVGVDRSVNGFDAALEQSKQKADAIAQLMRQRLDTSRVRVYGLGPLAPLMIGEGEAGVYLIRE